MIEIISVFFVAVMMVVSFILGIGVGWSKCEALFKGYYDYKPKDKHFKEGKWIDE